MTGPGSAGIDFPPHTCEFPMRSFLHNLFRVRTAKPARRHANLQVEGLESRLVPTSVSLTGSTATIDVSPNQFITLQSTGFNNGFRGLRVFDNGVLVNNPNNFNISNITAVNIQVTGGDSVLVDDSNGMPFAQQCAIAVGGSGSNNALSLAGSRGISGGETYIGAGVISAGVVRSQTELSVDNLTFTVGSAVGRVNDLFAITGDLDVQASGTNVLLTGANGATQTLTGLSSGGGNVLAYAGKNVIKLEEDAPNARVTLAATLFDSPNPAGIDGATDLVFQVNMHGANDTTDIAATPSNVTTEVNTIVAPVTNAASVLLSGNAGAVLVEGNAGTQMAVGKPLSTGGSSTSAIQADVNVIGVGALTISDSGNAVTPENVTVTPTTISGSGLFGNSGVKLFYSGVGPDGVSIFTGKLADQYTVTGDGFDTPVSITSDSSVSFRADVFVDPKSDLELFLFHGATPESKSVLDIHPTDVKVKISHVPNGVADVFAGDVLTSQIFFNGFDKVSA